MNARIFLCDSANVSDNGTRFNATGAGITFFKCGQMPAPVNFALLIETSFSPAESEKEYAFEIKILDSEGRPVAPVLTGTLQALKGHYGSFYTAFNLQMIMKKTSTITFSLMMNGEEKDCVVVRVSD